MELPLAKMYHRLVVPPKFADVASFPPFFLSLFSEKLDQSFFWVFEIDCNVCLSV